MVLVDLGLFIPVWPVISIFLHRLAQARQHSGEQLQYDIVPIYWNMLLDRFDKFVLYAFEWIRSIQTTLASLNFCVDKEHFHHTNQS